MDGLTDSEPDLSEYVEVDPTGRYGRYNEVLGRGASKTVYRAFDEYEGIEVAWNQVRVHDFLQSAKDLEMIYCEIHLLKTLKHKNIMKSYTSWIDTSNRQINFITEMFTSGTLRQYRLKHKRVSIRAVKHWCRQILEGLLYLHSHDPPVIHRDLKCDNIFINGNQGEVKIGDLGLAAILSNSHVVHCVGTPEFMAPEMYGKAGYNELVDIYSFGMCILEMVTFEYPYSECTNPAHIYKKVISGKRPNALYKVKDPEVRQFIEKCLGTVSSRLSARELLNDPFLQTDVHDYDLRSIDCNRESDGINPLARQSVVDPCISDCSYRSWNCNSSEYEPYNGERHDYQVEPEASGNKLFDHRDEEEHSNDHMDIAIKGTREEDGNIFLRLRIADKEGQIRNIYFPFDVEMDTALNVATEMVAELEITDQDVTYIAEMIDGEISKLVAEWNSGPVIEEDLSAENTKTCLNCDSTHTSFASCMKLLSSSPDHCSDGHFEEFMPVDEFEHDAVEGEGDKLPTSTKQPTAALELIEKWDCQESVEISSLGSGISQSDDGYKKAEKLVSPKHEIDGNQSEEQSFKSCSVSTLPSLQQIRSMSDDFENDIQWEMRWLKAKLQLEVREIMNQRLRIPSKCSTRDKPVRDQQFSTSYQKSLEMAWRSDNVLASMDFRSPAETTYLSSVNQGVRSHEAMMRGFPYSNDIAVKSLCGSSLLPGVLQRTTSLPVDAVHI